MDVRFANVPLDEPVLWGDRETIHLKALHLGWITYPSTGIVSVAEEEQ